MIVKVKNNVQKKTKKVKNNFVKTKKGIKSFFKEKGKMQKIKKLFIKIKKFFLRKEILDILILSLPFVAMDISTRLFASTIDFYSLFKITPRLFSLAYIILFIGISLNIKRKYGKIVYNTCFLIFYLLFLVHNIYFSVMGNFFGFSLLALAGEGSDYFFDALKNCNILVYIVAVIIFLSYLFAVKSFPKKISFHRKRIIWVLIVFVGLHVASKLFLGSTNFELTWDSWRNPRNVYNNFNDSNKCLTLSGLYEYTFRDFYITYIRPKEKKSDTESKFLEEVFSDNNDSINKNKYTGKFKGKNVIFLQLEGIDSWLLTKEIMPNTCSLLNNAINFTNHYSFYNGGGSTFNSEFMVNTGYTTPYTYPMNAYTLNRNDFPYSMANLMKKKDYSIQVFHMNSKEYYSRGINYFNWGYDNYYGLKDLGIYEDNSYQLDRELILNETFYNEMFKNPNKFVNYIITYSNHLPFESGKGVCNQLLKLDYQEKLSNMSSTEQKDFLASLEMTEEDCIKRQARETDYMVGLLMKALKDNNLYNNTVIFAYADHYLYTVSDKEILKKNGKDIETNFINHTPFFIWSSNLKKEEVKKVTTQLNILPTFLNLMGITYNEKWYVLNDIFSPKYRPLVIYPDMSWYDGTYYVENGIIKNKKNLSSNSLEEKNSYSAYLIKKNDLVLKYNYFKEIMND